MLATSAHQIKLTVIGIDYSPINVMPYPTQCGMGGDIVRGFDIS